MQSRMVNKCAILVTGSLLMMILFACSPGSGTLRVQLALQSDGSLKITGPDTLILHEIQRDSIPWQALYPVYRMPADSDMKDFQTAQSGKYRLDGNAVLFTPDTPFTAGIIYFLRWANFENSKDAWSILANRHKPGTNSYTDLTFKK